MMKQLLILCIIIITACNSYKKSSETGFKNYRLYEVYKIDSINNYYLIYAKNEEKLYKIVSDKLDNEYCKLIKKGKQYKFNLHSVSDNAPTIGGIKLKPINYLDVPCYQFDNETKICREEGMDDLYFADNIKGLCFIK